LFLNHRGGAMRIVSLLVIILLFPLLLGFTDAQPNNSGSRTITTTITIRIHMLKAIDYVDVLDVEDLYYGLWIDDVLYNTPTVVWNTNPSIVDDTFTYVTSNESITISIALWEYDATSDVDECDISSQPGGGQDDNYDTVCHRSAYFEAHYNVRDNTLIGDRVDIEGHYYVTSGDFDGSTWIDENDGAVWFNITDDFGNIPPTPRLTSNYKSPRPFVSITFDGSTSIDIDGKVMKYFFDFGDGTTTNWTGNPKYQHRYPKVGDYFVTLKVMDDEELVSDEVANITIMVREPPQGGSELQITESGGLCIVLLLGAVGVIAIIMYLIYRVVRKPKKTRKNSEVVGTLTSEAKETSARFCPECGAEVKKGKFCTNCGTKISEE